MGNKVSAASKPPNDLGMFTSMPPTVSPEKKEVKLENPGSMEELHKKTKDVFPVVFDGAKIIWNKGLASRFQITHTISLSHQQPGSYRFGTSYVAPNLSANGEPNTILMGDIDYAGQLNANIIHSIGDRTKLKFQSQMSNRNFQVVQCQMDYKADNSTWTFMGVNIDALNNFRGVYVSQYLHSITANLALGAELVVQRSHQVPGGQTALLSLAGRYTGSDFVCAGTLGPSALHCSYYQKASEQLHFGAEVETNFLSQESVGTIGYFADVPKADLQFRGSVDTNWNVTGSLEKKLLPMPFSLTLCGILNQKKHSFRLGLGFLLG